MPSGRDSRSHPYPGHRPVSDKEEIARAALRSLAAPNTDSAPSEQPPPLLPRPPLVSPSHPAGHLPPPLPSQSGPSRDYSRLPYDKDVAHDDRAAAYADDARSMRSSTITAHGQAQGASSSSLTNMAMTRNDSSSTFFHDQHITASPDASPKLEATSFLPPPPSHRHARHSVPSSTSSGDLHEVALRRASLALGVNLEEVRQIVNHAYVARRTSNSSSSASVSASSQGYMPPSLGPNGESAFVRQVLDAYCLESDRASQTPSAYEAHRRESTRASLSTHAEARSAAPSGLTWHEASHAPGQPSQPRHYQSDHGTSVAWGTRADERLPTFDAHHPDSSFRSARPAYNDPRRYEASASTSTMTSVPEQRAESPSPFAYDAYRRTSQPVIHEFGTAGASRLASRVSQGYLDDSARSRAIEEERTGGQGWSRSPISPYGQPPHPPHSSMYARRVRSIDDYLEQQQQQQQQLQRQEQGQYRQRRGSVAHHPGRTQSVVEYDDDRLPDRHMRSSVRHSFQPYPPPSSRYAPGSSAVGSAPPPVQSPQLSPTMPEAPRFQPFSQHRSPLLRSPAAETVASVASSSVTSVAALSPSPLLGAGGSSSASLTPDERRRSPGVDTDAQSSLRAVSEDTAAETTRAGVARMQIDDTPSSFKGTKASARKSRSTRSSFSHSDRGSAPIMGTDLSHSEIMQKLQDKVKSRLAAKGKAAMLSGNGTDGQGKNGKKAVNAGASSSNGSNKAKAAKVGRSASTKRSASSIARSDSSTRALAASPNSSRRNSASSTTATAETSAAPVGGVPAPKVRRTSATSQPKPVPKPPSQSPPKPSSPSSSSAKSNATPTSIEAALLSPTDTPTPSEAAANHAQRMSRSPLSPEGAVETASGQALPSELPGAGQMNASSATKQQTSMAGIDSLLQAAQANDPTETNSAIA